MADTRSGPNKEAWIGLAHVRPKPGTNNLEGALGAFVPVLVLADCAEGFAAAAATCLDSYGFDVIEIEDIELFADRVRTQTVHEDIRKLAASLSPQQPVAVDTFQAYEDEQ